MINLLKLIFLTIFKKNEKNTISIYDTFSKLMQIITGGNMLNFGYWDINTTDPFIAQQKLTTLLGEFAGLEKGNKIIDIGSGFSDPAFQWIDEYKFLKILCININFYQLKFVTNTYKKKIGKSNTLVQFLNSTSTRMPIGDNTYDKIIAFESAQHFKPLVKFIEESYRILKLKGHLILALPVITYSSKFGILSQIRRLGILYITWASEHYHNEEIIRILEQHGFTIQKVKYIGSNVYSPLADYYINKRGELRKVIIKTYPSFLERLLFKSIKKMKSLSSKGDIDYILIDAEKNEIKY